MQALVPYKLVRTTLSIHVISSLLVLYSLQSNLRIMYSPSSISSQLLHSYGPRPLQIQIYEPRPTLSVKRRTTSKRKRESDSQNTIESPFDFASSALNPDEKTVKMKTGEDYVVDPVPGSQSALLRNVTLSDVLDNQGNINTCSRLTDPKLTKEKESYVTVNPDSLSSETRPIIKTKGAEESYCSGRQFHL